MKKSFLKNYIFIFSKKTEKKKKKSKVEKSQKK